MCNIFLTSAVAFEIESFKTVKLDWSVYTCLTKLYGGRDMCNLLHKDQLHVSALFVGHDFKTVDGQEGSAEVCGGRFCFGQRVHHGHT